MGGAPTLPPPLPDPRSGAFVRLIRAPLFPTRIKIPQDWVPDGIITAYFEATAQLTAKAIPGFTRTANLSTSAQLSAVIFAKATAVGNLTASAQLSATVAEREFVTANMSATAQLSASTIVGFARTANFTADAQLSATNLKAQYVRTAGFSADASLTATTFPRYVMTVPLSATATLAATVVEREIATANFTAAAQLSASVMARIALTANLSADASLTAVARKPYPTITATAQTASTLTAMTSFTINLSTADVGDTRLIILETYSTTPATPPSGWTLIGKQANSNTASISLYRRTKVAGDLDTVTVTVNATSGAAQCLTIVNCGSLNIFAGSFSTSSVTPHVTPAVPNTAPGGLVIRAAAYRATVYGQSHTWGAGVTALPTVNTPSGNPDTLSVAWSIQEAISEGTIVNATPAASRPYNAISVVATPPAPVATLKPGRIMYSASPTQVAVNNVPLELNTWTNDPAYPLTVSTVRGLVVQGDGPGYLTVNFTRQNYWNAFTVTIKADGQAIFVFNGSGTSSTMVNQFSVATDFVSGTLLTYEYWTANTAVNSGNVTTTNTNLTLTPSVYPVARMIKDGDWTPPADLVWTTVPGWSAEAGTVVTNGLKSSTAKTGTTVAATLMCMNNTGTLNADIQLLVDGVVVKTVLGVPLAGYAVTPLTITSDSLNITTSSVVTVQIKSQYAVYMKVMAVDSTSGAPSYLQIN